MRSKNAWRAVLWISIAALVALAVFFVVRFMQDWQSEQEYENLRQYGPAVAQTGFRPTLASAEHQVSAEEPPSSLWYPPSVPGEILSAGDGAGHGKVDFSSLSAINRDVVAWIELDGTNISYPVAQASNDTYYLDHSFSLGASRSGCIFLGAIYASDFSDFNSVLYGHHMKSGAMFQPVTLYKEAGFFKTHPTGTLYTPQGDYRLDIFSAYVADGNGDFQRSGFTGPEDTNDFYQLIAQRSQVPAPFVPVWPQRVLSLVTCSYEYNNARYVVHARMTPI